MREVNWARPPRVAPEHACLDCNGTGDTGPWFADTSGSPIRMACRTCHGSGEREYRCGLGDIAWHVFGLLALAMLLFAGWVMTP